MEDEQLKQIIRLYPGDDRGWGRDKRKRRYYLVWEVDGLPHRTYLETKTEEETKAERARRYTELQMNGATWLRENVKPNRLMDDGPDAGIVQKMVLVPMYEVKVGTVVVGITKSKQDARAMRKAYLVKHHLRGDKGRRYSLRKCLLCLRRPRMNFRTETGCTITHKCSKGGDVVINTKTVVKSVRQWNLHRMKKNSRLPRQIAEKNVGMEKDPTGRWQTRVELGWSRNELCQILGCMPLTLENNEKGKTPWSKKFLIKWNRVIKRIRKGGVPKPEVKHLNTNKIKKIYPPGTCHQCGDALGVGQNLKCEKHAASLRLRVLKNYRRRHGIPLDDPVIPLRERKKLKQQESQKP